MVYSVTQPMYQSITVPVLPHNLQQNAFRCNYDAPMAGHLDAEKTLFCLRHGAFWTNMARRCKRVYIYIANSLSSLCTLNNQHHCRTFLLDSHDNRQLAVDILQVSLSAKYLLVIQDYFAKWADAIPLPDQTAELRFLILHLSLLIFSAHAYDSPQIVHTD